MDIVKPDSGVTVLQAAAVALGDGTALKVNEAGAVGVQIVGITSATITFEGTVDGTNWVSVLAQNVATGATGATASADGIYIANVVGLTQFRARISTWATGTITVTAQRLALNSGLNFATASIGTIAAGTNIIGKVGIDQTTPGTTDRVTAGGTALLTSTPTLSVAGAYATGDYIGPTTTPASFTNVSRASGFADIVKSLVIIDKVTTAAVALELWLFSATFTAPTDNAAWAITDAEALTCLGVIPIGTSKWYANSNNKVYSDDTLGLVIKPAVTTIFYALVARGTTPTWADGDLQVSIGVLQQ